MPFCQAETISRYIRSSRFSPLPTWQEDVYFGTNYVFSCHCCCFFEKAATLCQVQLHCSCTDSQEQNIQKNNLPKSYNSSAMMFMYKERCKPDRITDIYMVIKYAYCIYWCPNFMLNVFISNLLKTMVVFFSSEFVTLTNKLPVDFYISTSKFVRCTH